MPTLLWAFLKDVWVAKESLFSLDGVKMRKDV